MNADVVKLRNFYVSTPKQLVWDILYRHIFCLLFPWILERKPVPFDTFGAFDWLAYCIGDQACHCRNRAKLHKIKDCLTFRAFGVVISDNKTLSTVQIVKDYMAYCETKWIIVLSYAPISNERAERIVVTNKRSIAHLLARVKISKMLQGVKSYSSTAVALPEKVIFRSSFYLEISQKCFLIK